MKKPSLRSRLLRHVLIPLSLAWILALGTALSLAYHFAGQAYDRALLDDAQALAAQVSLDATGKTALSLSSAEMTAVLFDSEESIYFAIRGREGRLIAGHGALLVPQEANVALSQQLLDAAYSGKDVRVAVLQRTLSDTQGFSVVVAQTTASRSELLKRLIAMSVLPQLLLLILLAWWLMRRVGADLDPLVRMQQALAKREANDLQPLDVAFTTQATTRDVQRLGVAVNNLFGRIASSVADQREFSGNVAHELRTPLAGIRAQAEYALTTTKELALIEQLKGIVTSADRASHLTNQLLALAYADESAQSLILEAVDLNLVARAAVLRHLARARKLGVDLGAEFGAEGADAPVVVTANHILLDAVLDNLIDNALRYGGGASEPTITIAVAKTSDGAWLHVRDNGKGLDEEERQMVLGRWKQGVFKSGGGSGLGLAIVRRYAQLLRASFVLDADIDHGAAPTCGLCASIKLRSKLDGA